MVLILVWYISLESCFDRFSTEGKLFHRILANEIGFGVIGTTTLVIIGRVISSLIISLTWSSLVSYIFCRFIFIKPFFSTEGPLFHRILANEIGFGVIGFTLVIIRRVISSLIISLTWSSFICHIFSWFTFIEAFSTE